MTDLVGCLTHFLTLLLMQRCYQDGSAPDQRQFSNSFKNILINQMVTPRRYLHKKTDMYPVFHVIYL